MSLGRWLAKKADQARVETAVEAAFANIEEDIQTAFAEAADDLTNNQLSEASNTLNALLRETVSQFREACLPQKKSSKSCEALVNGDKQ